MSSIWEYVKMFTTVLEILSVAPTVIGVVKSGVAAVNAATSTGDKVKAVADCAEALAAELRSVLNNL